MNPTSCLAAQSTHICNKTHVVKYNQLTENTIYVEVAITSQLEAAKKVFSRYYQLTGNSSFTLKSFTIAIARPVSVRR